MDDGRIAIAAEEDSTQGINTLALSFPMVDADHEFIMHIWDFGGQEIQYATHQFFLSPRALYVLLCNDRSQETRYEYWFDMIKLLGQNSPVLVVLNEHAGNQITNFDAKTWKKRLGETIDLQVRTVDFSEKDSDRFRDVRKTIQSTICNLKHIGDVVPAYWKAIRDRLNQRKTDNYINLYTFRDDCFSEGLSDESQQDTLLQYFRDLGFLLHFNEGNLKETVFLNPRWVLDAVYAVLTSGAVQKNGGEFNEDWLFDVWANKGYNQAERANLLELMLKDRFEICYRVRKTKTFIAPQLLPVSEPAYSWDDRDNLWFRFKFPVMPRGFMARLIVRLHTLIDRKKAWRHGMLLRYKGAKALVQERMARGGEKVIQIQAAGAANPRGDLFDMVRSEVRKLHRDAFESWPIVEEVPFAADPDVAVKFDFLRRLRAKGVKTFLWPDIEKEISVRQMLEGIEEQRPDYEDERIIVNLNIKNEQHQQANPTIQIENQSHASNQVSQTVDVDQTVTFNLRQEWNGLHNGLGALAEDVADVDAEAARQLDKIAEKMADVDTEQAADEAAKKKAVGKPMSRLEALWTKLKDPDNKLRKAIEAAEGGIDSLRHLAAKYNRIAEWGGMPQVPDVFTK